MANNWHPQLPTSKRAKSILYDDNGRLFLDGDGEVIRLDQAMQNCNETRFIIGTIAAKLCREMEQAAKDRQQYEAMNQWSNTAFEWALWAEGKD